MSGVIFSKPQPGVPGWGLGAQGGNGGGGGFNPTAISNAGGLVNMFTGRVNNPFSDPALKGVPTTPVDPYSAGGVFGPTPTNASAPGSVLPMPEYLRKNYPSPLPPPGPTATPAPPQPGFLDSLLQMLMQPQGGTVKSTYDLKGALGDVGKVYAPELSALDRLVAQKKGNEVNNEAKLKALYANLVADTQNAGVQGDQHYTDLMGKQAAATQAERDAITQRYAQQLADMQKQMHDTGFANLIPERTQKLQDQMNHELANINTQGDIAKNQSQGLQGSQHNWYGESANVNRGQGVNAIAASMRQLQDALSQIDQQRGGILSQQAQAQLAAQNANRAAIQQAASATAASRAPNYDLMLKIYEAKQAENAAKTKAQTDAAQQKFDNAVKAYAAGKGVLSATTGQSTMDPNALKQIMAAMGQ